MPDDARFFAHDARFCRLQRKKLRGPHHLLYPAVKHNAIMYKAKQPLLVEHLRKQTIDKRLYLRLSPPRRCARIATRLFPLQPVFFRRKRSRILEPFRFIARHQELRRGKKRRYLPLLLIAVVLANPLGHAHIRLL